MIGIMPDEVSIIRNNWTTRSPIISDNGHLEGHYPAYTMVTYEINKYKINYYYNIHRGKIVRLFFTNFTNFTNSRLQALLSNGARAI